MKKLITATLAAAVVLTGCQCPCGFSSSYDADVVIYGNTSAAVTAAVQAARMGKSVIMVGPDKHLGGLSSGGLGWTDSGKADSIGGLSREFYQRVYTYYTQPKAWTWETEKTFESVPGQETKARNREEKTQWLFEPHVAESVFDNWVKEAKIRVFRDQWLDRANGVKKEGAKITSITMLSGKTFTGRMFIDCTYEGDLMATAGVKYHVGREANSVYGEKHNGVQLEKYKSHKHYFMSKVSPYKVPGDPKSGLLPYVSGKDPGKTGEGDRGVQAYCFRMCMTKDPRNRIPFPKPDNYDPLKYELLAREYESGRPDFFEKFDMIPNLKTDTNNHGPLSSDMIGCNWDYPEASYERRAEIIKEHEDYQKGLYYFVANEPRMPEFIRKEMALWGLPKDEFKDNGGWPHQLYIREARRMIGVYVMTEMDVLHEREVPQPVGMGSYTLDSHNIQRYVTPEGFVQNEGDVGVHTKGAYRISYGSIIPKKAECENLLVPVAMSSSHIAYGSIRMEPVFMILGQSAATAAVQAMDAGKAVQDIDYGKLAGRLKADGQRF